METPSAGASGEIFDSVGKSQGGLPTSGDGPTAAVLRYAAQPDVVLSQERDLYYAETLLGESASELAETLLGSRRAVILGPELKALASCLYFGLTNFAGELIRISASVARSTRGVSPLLLRVPGSTRLLAACSKACW